MWSPALSLALPFLLAAGADLFTSTDVVRMSFVRLPLERLESAESIRLQLFDDVRLEAVRERLVPHGPGRFVWIGRARGDESSAIVLSSSMGVLSGSLRTATAQYRIRPTGGLLHRVEEVSTAAEPPGNEPLVPVLGGQRGAGLGPATDDGSYLDLLVAYTPRARLAARGEQAIEALVQLGIAETNWALEKSGVSTRVRLVELVEAPYRESGRAESDLEILKLDGDGALDELHRLRDASGADFVQLVVEERDGCGISYALGGDAASLSDFAFSVVERSCIDSSYAIAHELGHNFGCDHAPEDPRTTGAFAYSFGYKDLLSGFRTIMAYGPGRRIARFSSPRVAFAGVPAGAPGQDNARTIEELRRELARFRASVAPPRLETAFVPARDSTLVRLRSTAGTVREWHLLLGTTPGGSDRFASGPRAQDDVVEVPARAFDGHVVHARLWYRRGRVWLFEDLRLDSLRQASRAILSGAQGVQNSRN